MIINQVPDGKVLVVDDLPTNLLIIKGLLNPYGMQVDTAASGQEAIDLVRKHEELKDKRYDLIFMDHMMPDMDGIETAKAIHAMETEYANKTPIIALTANALQEMKEFYLKQGFHDYLSKPIVPKSLDEVLNRWMPEHKKIQNLPGSSTRISNIAVAMAAQRIDMLKHYRVSFESNWKFDAAYFKRFTALLESLDTEGLSISFIFCASLHCPASFSKAACFFKSMFKPSVSRDSSSAVNLLKYAASNFQLLSKETR
jgi:CheY-like chemotaxis protein